MMSDKAIQFVGDVQKLSLKPDDVLVFRHDLTVSLDEVKHVISVLQKQFPGQRLLVMRRGFSVGVLSDESSVPEFLKGFDDEG